LNEPTSGGPLVVTCTEAEESPHDKVKINNDEGESMLILITKLTLELLFAGTETLKGDAAAMLRLNESLLITDQVDRQTILVITSPLRMNFT
jgi:hypothetical protein